MFTRFEIAGKNRRPVDPLIDDAAGHQRIDCLLDALSGSLAAHNEAGGLTGLQTESGSSSIVGQKITLRST